jgi:ATP-dependent DNA ligase
MDLPVMPPVAPMLARAVTRIPAPDSVPAGLQYEPKWDGFRAIVFADGRAGEIEITSRSKKSLTRYFPELVAAFATELPPRCVVDGEIVLAQDGHLSFPSLSERIHPAESRVQRLATETPAQYVAFDLLALDDHDLRDRPLQERRRALEEALPEDRTIVHLTPASTDLALAEDWFHRLEGAGLDGILAKDLSSPYSPGKRTMVKVKHARTADCVVGGMREHAASTQEEPLLGSLLLGLYRSDGVLQHVGVAGSFPMAARADLYRELIGLRCDPSEHPWGRPPEQASGHTRRPGMQSRWSAGKDLSFVPLRPDLVCEVSYDAMEGDRFRHTAHLKRWRPDREPRSCTYDQLERPLTVTLSEILHPT